MNSSPLLFGGSVLVVATMNNARVLAAPFKKAPCCPEPLKRNGTGNLDIPQLAEARRLGVPTVAEGLIRGSPDC